MHDSDSSCYPTPVADLRLPTQSTSVGYQTPSETKLSGLIEKRYGKLDQNPDSDKPTSFRRGIPGQSNQ